MAKAAGGREIPFSEFWAKLADRYGEDVHECARRRWAELSLPTSGKINVVDWRDFKIKFMDIWHDIPKANQEESYQILMGKMPNFITNWIIEEQERQRRKAPRITISPMVGVDRNQVMDSIGDMTGQRPKDAWKMDGNTYVVEFTENRPILSLLGSNGKRLRGGSILKIERMEQKLSVAEIFDHVEWKFNTIEKQSANHRQGFKRQEREVKANAKEGGVPSPQTPQRGKQKGNNTGQASPPAAAPPMAAPMPAPVAPIVAAPSAAPIAAPMAAPSQPVGPPPQVPNPSWNGNWDNGWGKGNGKGQNYFPAYNQSFQANSGFKGGKGYQNNGKGNGKGKGGGQNYGRGKGGQPYPGSTLGGNGGGQNN